MARRVFVFDAYGTLFDLNAAIGRHRQALGPDADHLAAVWRTKQLEYSWTLTLAGRYVDFWTLTQRALEYALDRTATVDGRLKAPLLEAYLTLDAYPDARTTIERLKAQNQQTAILSNGSPFMLNAAVGAAGLGPALDAVLSVDTIGLYKPHPEVYGLVIDRFEVSKADVTFISSNRWDVMGAASYGFRAISINRNGGPDEYPEAQPVTAVQNLTSVLSVD